MTSVLAAPPSGCGCRPAATAFARTLGTATIGGGVLGAAYGLVLVTATLLIAAIFSAAWGSSEPRGLAEVLGELGVLLAGLGATALLLGAVVGLLFGLAVGPVAWLAAVLTGSVPWPLRRVLIAAAPTVLMGTSLMIDFFGGLTWLVAPSILVVAVAVYVRAPRALRGLPGVPATPEAQR